MSWDSYVTNLLASNTLTDVAICDLEGNVWAKSPNMVGSPAELKNIHRAFSNASAIMASGIVIGNTKYMFLRATDDNILGKLKNDGICVSLCSKCMLVGIYKDGQTPGGANNSICKMAEYLKSVGY